MIASLQIPTGFALLGQKYIEKNLSESEACTLLLVLQQTPELIYTLWDQLRMHQMLREHVVAAEGQGLTCGFETSIAFC